MAEVQPIFYKGTSFLITDSLFSVFSDMVRVISFHHDENGNRRGYPVNKITAATGY